MSDITMFIGVDLAWKSDKNHSSVVVAQGFLDAVQIVAFSNGITTLDEVLAYVITHATENTVVAIDAPLVIANQGGQRPCETSIGQRFGAQDASPHTSNLSLYPDSGSVRLESILRTEGFSHQPCPAKDKHKRGKWFFEVYPHPAQVVLFNLKKIIKYKKGTVSKKKAGLQTLRGCIQDCLCPGNPSLQSSHVLDDILSVNLERLAGKSLKCYEDCLDACICAYLAFFYWYWGDEKNEIIGDISSGYIINPTEPARALIPNNGF